jgi:peptidyl-Asp metalloendopeptidase
VFLDSRTRVSLELVGVRKIPFTPTERVADLQALVRKRDGRMDEVHALRDSLKADIVVLFTPLANGTINGSVLATEATAFVIAEWGPAAEPDYALAHELAHLFGAMHPGTTGPVAGQLPEGFPWGDDSIRTVLDWSPGRTVPYFSNPDLSVGGKALGVKGNRDIAAVIRRTAAYVAGFRGPRPTTDFVPAGTIPSADFTE